MASIGSVLGSVGTAGSSGTTSATGNSSNASSSSATNPLANESTFLQLLVTQIQNQDPTQPMDSTAFLSELAQFSQLEQLSNIGQDLQTGVPVFAQPQTTSTSATPAASPTTAS